MNKDNQIVIYRAKDGRTTVEVNLRQESLWLSLQQMADLFDRDKSVISRHITNIFKTNELSRESVVAKNATTAADGKTYLVDYYNLDLILSVGYRVNSKRGTQFRIWATQVLCDHLLKGYTVNEKRLREQVTRLKELQATVDLLGRVILSLVPRRQPHSLPLRRHQTPGRQRPGRPHPPHCRKSTAR